MGYLLGIWADSLSFQLSGDLKQQLPPKIHQEKNRYIEKFRGED